MKTLLKILVVLVVLAAVLVAGGLWYANRYVQTPAFKQRVLAAARSAVGTEVAINDLRVSLWEGLALRGVTVANPAGFKGSLLTAEAFTLRYRLLPLLRKKLEITELSLVAPVVTLAKNDKGEWNYDKLGGAPTTGTAPAKTGGTTASPVDIEISKIALSRGAVTMLGDKGKALVTVQGLDFASAISLAGNKLSGTGKAGVTTVNVADSLMVRSFAAPVALSPAEVKLAPLSGKVAGGDIGGEVTLRLKDGFGYQVQLQVKNSDMATLLQEAGTKVVLTGKLQLDTALTGTGGLETMAGKGTAEITGGQLMEIPLMNLLATLLQVPELRGLQFSECRLEFTIANNQMPTPVIRLVAPQVQVTGKGVVSLADYSLNHDMTLTLAPGLVAKVPKEIRGVFAAQPDGSLAISFHVSGPYDAPKTDLTERIAKGAVGGLLEKGLQKLFR